VPLVVPELNGDKLLAVKEKGKGIIANPNCTTAILAIALFPLHKAFGGANRLICSTYQAASGAGDAGMQELSKALEKRAKNEKFIPTVFSHDLSCNVIPLIDAVGSGSGGYTQEELKMAVETRKIFDSSFDISCTAVRVPTMRSHCVSASVEFKLPAPPDRVLEVLQGSVGVHVVEVPTPEEATQRKDVLVGRIRQSLVFGDRGIDMFVAGDQLLRGAALNAVRIALLLV
jgi:aspartate-semialdehyde dehydrogenase